MRETANRAESAPCPCCQLASEAWKRRPLPAAALRGASAKLRSRVSDHRGAPSFFSASSDDDCTVWLVHSRPAWRDLTAGEEKKEDERKRGGRRDRWIRERARKRGGDTDETTRRKKERERGFALTPSNVSLYLFFFPSSGNYVVKREAIKTQEIEQQSHLRGCRFATVY